MDGPHSKLRTAESRVNEINKSSEKWYSVQIRFNQGSSTTMSKRIEYLF